LTVAEFVVDIVTATSIILAFREGRSNVNDPQSFDVRLAMPV
jgi:hypothetical protein